MVKKGSQMPALPLFDTRQPNPSVTVLGGFRPEAELVLFAGDTLDLLAIIPDHSVQLIVTSPPYNLGKSYEDRITQQRIEEFRSGTLKIRPLGKPVHEPSGNEKISQPPPEWRQEASAAPLFDFSSDEVETESR
jgi:hypothetical protein